VNETPSNTGMGPDEPVGSKRSGQRNRYIVILGGLAVVLVAGVILAGVIPTGDRAGSTTSDPSPSPSASATVEVTTCADGGECQVGDIGPGGGLVFYDAGSAQDWGQYIEMAPKDWNDVCGSDLLGCSWSDGLSAAASYRGGGLEGWVVPSKSVLSAMYSFKSSITDGSQYYFHTRSPWWSSNQKTKSDAWCQYFDNGRKASCYKPQELSVRVVRSF